MGFAPGNPGRPKGAQNKTTREVRDIARRLVDAPAYRKSLMARLQAGKLAPAMETLLWHYARGKPSDHVEVTGDGDAPLKVIFGGRLRESNEEPR